MTVDSCDLGSGARGANDAMVHLVYRELRRLAAAYLRHERRCPTLQPTALVHEAYLRLARRGAAWGDRREILAAGASAMRHVLIDHARRRLAEKRGHGTGAVSISALADAGGETASAVPSATALPYADLIDLDTALDELRGIDPELVRIVELRYFAGFTIEETSDVLGVSPATVKRAWAAARAWLYERLGGSRL